MPGFGRAGQELARGGGSIGDRLREVERELAIDFADYFAGELRELETGPGADGLLGMGSDALEVTPLGRLFIRNVCMVFDRYLREKPRSQPTFSRTV